MQNVETKGMVGRVPQSQPIQTLIESTQVNVGSSSSGLLNEEGLLNEDTQSQGFQSSTKST